MKWSDKKKYAHPDIIRVPMVYILYNKDVPVYVGSTKCIEERLFAHSKGGKEFTHYSFCEVPENEMFDIEIEWQFKLRPILCQQMPPSNRFMSKLSAKKYFSVSGLYINKVIREQNLVEFNGRYDFLPAINNGCFLEVEGK